MRPTAPPSFVASEETAYREQAQSKAARSTILAARRVLQNNRPAKLFHPKVPASGQFGLSVARAPHGPSPRTRTPRHRAETALRNAVQKFQTSNGPLRSKAPSRPQL